MKRQLHRQHQKKPAPRPGESKGLAQKIHNIINMKTGIARQKSPVSRLIATSMQRAPARITVNAIDKTPKSLEFSFIFWMISWSCPLPDKVDRAEYRHKIESNAPPRHRARATWMACQLNDLRISTFSLGNKHHSLTTLLRSHCTKCPKSNVPAS